MNYELSDVVRVSISVSAFGLWLSDIVNSPALFTHSPNSDCFAVMQAMYLIVGPFFVLGPLYDDYQDEPTVNKPQIPAMSLELNRAVGYLVK